MTGILINKTGAGKKILSSSNLSKPVKMICRVRANEPGSGLNGNFQVALQDHLSVEISFSNVFWI